MEFIQYKFEGEPDGLITRKEKQEKEAAETLEEKKKEMEDYENEYPMNLKYMFECFKMFEDTKAGN